MDERDRETARVTAERELRSWIMRFGSLGYAECMAMMDIVFVSLYENWRERREALRAAGASIGADPDPE